MTSPLHQTDIRLQVLIVTYGSRLTNLINNKLPEIEGVGWLISCQDPDNQLQGIDIRPLMERNDIDLRIYRDRGISNNRNHSLDAASAPYLLLADDDLIFLPEGLKALIKAFDSNPQVDIIALKAKVNTNRVSPPCETDLPKLCDVISFEIALRRNSILHAALRFSTLAGIGAPYLGSGEEDLFLLQARRRGLKIRYFPITHVEHPELTTCDHSATSPAVLRAKGAVITALRGPLTALSRFPIEAYRSKAPFFKAMWCYFCGFFYYFTHRHQLLDG